MGGMREGSLDDNLGSPERFRSVGIEGPKMSVSRIPLRWPRRAKARARFTGGGLVLLLVRVV